MARSILTTVVFAALMCQVLAANNPSDVSVIRGIEYAAVNGTSLKLDLYLPKVEPAPPLVVWIHGGGWRKGSRVNPRLKALTKHGYAVASIDYRLTNTAIFPAQIHDCKAAVRWLRANAKRFGYQKDWIAVAGSSAGGHLALLMGTSGDVKELEGEVGGDFDQSSRVQAVIDYFGPSDFELRGKTQSGRAYTGKSGSLALLGGTPEQRPDVQMERLASPTTYVSTDDPPSLIFHGTKDRTVLLDQSEQMARRYREIGLSVELHVVTGAGHGDQAFFEDENFAKALAFLKDSLERTGP